MPAMLIATWNSSLLTNVDKQVASYVCILHPYRLLHRVGFLYKHVHKYHHDWTAPCAMATFYCHPLEHYFVNLGPLTLGPVLVGAHLSTAWLWYIISLLSTTFIHSGYHFPFFPSPESHDYHHSRFAPSSADIFHN